MTLVLLAVVAGVAVFTMVMALIPESGPGLLASRLEYVESIAPLLDPTDMDKAEMSRPLAERLVQPLVAAVGSFMLQHTKSGQIQTLRIMIMKAGSDMRPERLLAFKVIGLAVGASVGFAATTLMSFGLTVRCAAVVAGCALGYFYPSSKLKGRIKKRAQEMRRDLPGILDLLTISMEAGLSFDMALNKVCESESGIMGDEFQHVLNEVRLGRPRMEAMTALAERNAVEELTTFVSAVVQAEPLGVSVASVLRIQSEELRRLRKQRAEEAGHKAPVMMLLPMMGCIFPCIFVILLGPAVITIMNSMK